MHIIELLWRDYHQLLYDARVLRTANELIQLGHTVTIIIFETNQIEKNEIETDKMKVQGIRPLPSILSTYFQVYKKKNTLFYRMMRLLLRPYFKHSLKQRFIEVALKESFDACWANDFETLPLAVELKKKTGCSVVYDAHEYWSGRFGVRGYIHFFNRMWLRFYEKYLIKKGADIITSVNPQIIKLLESPGKQTFCLYNIPPKKEINPLHQYFHKLYKLDQKTKILLYQGVLHRGKGIEFIIDSIQSFPQDWVVVFMGYGYLESPIKEKTNTKELKGRMFIHEAVPPKELLNYTSAADIGLCPVRILCKNYYLSLPNKFWYYLQAGIPIVSTRVPPMSAIHSHFHIGEEYEDENRGSFVEAIRKIFENYDSYQESISKAQKEFEYNHIVVGTYRNIANNLKNKKNKKSP